MAIEIFIAGAPPVVLEGGPLDEFTLLTSSPIPFGESVTVNFEILPGTAKPGEDYNYLSPTAVLDPLTGIYFDSATIPGGASISSFRIDLLQDTLIEGTELFNVNIVGVSGNAEFGQSSSVAVTILDDDNVVPSEEDGNFFNRDIDIPNSNQVTIATELNATEHSGNGQFLVILTEAAATETVITYSVEGTATANADYSTLPGSITIPAGVLTVPIDVTVLDDKYLEDRESVVATLVNITAGDDNLVLGAGNTATMVIADNEPSVLYRLNAGGPEITATDNGPNWLSDTSYLVNQGSSKIFSNPGLEPGPEFKDGIPSEIFRTERFDELSAVDDAELQYAFNIESGTYEVLLYMGNGFEGTSQSGERVFDVAVEGQVLQNLDNIDLSAKFGNLVGGVISNEVVVTDGVLNIDFLHDLSDGIQNPLINGIEILQISDDNEPSVLYRLNAGGPEITATDNGPNWLSDTSYLVNQGSSKIFSNPGLEPGPEFKDGIPSEIFRTERFDELSAVDDAELQYAFNIESGTYEVRLYMGNGFEGTSQFGERVFDVAVEGQVLQNLDNIDLSAKFGNLVGGVISNEVVVTDGVLNIDFLHDLSDGIQNPLINGIEILQISDDIVLPPTVSFVEEPTLLVEEGRLHKTTFITNEPVPVGSSVNVSVEIIPGSATPQQDYIYESASATFEPITGVYTDTITIPSSFSLGSVATFILPDAIEEGSEAFTVNIVDVDGANFETGSIQSVPITIIDDNSQLSPFRIEAEATTLSNFQLEDLSAASGGQAINFGRSEVNTDTTIGDIILREPLEGSLSKPGIAVDRIVAEQAQLGIGDTLNITGFENPTEVF